MQKTFMNLSTILKKLKINFNLIRFKICYPIKILPRTNYRLEIDCNELISEDCNIVLLHRSNKNINDTFNELGHLREDSILAENVPRLSMNFLGSFFKIKFIKYSAINPATKAWGGEKIDHSLYAHLFTIKRPSIPIFFKASDLHNKKFPFTLKKESPKAKEYLKYFNTKIGKETEEARFDGSLQIKHSPNKLNYWHIELLLMSPTGNEIRYTKSPDNLTTATLALTERICKSGKKVIPVTPEIIQTKFYFKEAV